MGLAHGKSTMSIRQTTRGTRRNHLKSAFSATRRTGRGKGRIIARHQMCPPTRARSRAKVRLRVSYFLAGSFPSERFRKHRRTVHELLDLLWRDQQLRTRAYEVSAPGLPRPLVFFLLSYWS